MVTIRVITSDSQVWNRDQTIIDMSLAMSTDDDITLDLVSEGPCFESLGLEDVISQLRDKHGYKKKIRVMTSNLVQLPMDGIEFDIGAQMSFVENTRSRLGQADTRKNISKKLGLFIGRSNAPRLDLASHCWKKSKSDLELTYHFDIGVDYHRNNIGLEEIARQQNTNDLTVAAEFLRNCPIKSDPVDYPILMDQHCNHSRVYSDFAIEVVCETYYTGQTFFPTEKTWRPIAMGTPFIVQGPQNFLQRLKQLGFKTFDRWWDEGYSEDPPEWQVTEIKRVVDFICSQDLSTIQQWYDEMTPVLEHNKKRLFDLQKEDFIGLE